MYFIKNFFISRENLNIIDIGTGNGDFIEIIKASFDNIKSLTAIDINEKTEKLIKEKYPEVNFFKTDINKNNFSDGQFDITCLSNTLHHIKDKNNLINQIKRITADSGYFILMEMTNDNLTDSQKSHMKIHHFAAKLDMLKGDYHENTMSKKDIIKIISENFTIKAENVFLWEKSFISEETAENFDKIFSLKISTLEKSVQEKLTDEKNTIINSVKGKEFQVCPELILICSKNNFK